MCVFFIIPILLLGVDEFILPCLYLVFESMMFMGMEGHHLALGGKQRPSGEGVSWAFP